MNIYLVTRTDGSVGYDEYDAFVVAAGNEIEANLMLQLDYPSSTYSHPWSDKTEVELIGTTDKYDKPTEILGSFNAG